MPRPPNRREFGLEGREFWGASTVHADLQQMLNLLLSTYENAVQNNRKLLDAQDQLRRANESLEERVTARTMELHALIAQMRVEVEERARAERRLSCSFGASTPCARMNMAIPGSLDLRVTLNVLLDQVTAHLDADGAQVLLLQRYSLGLEAVAGRGFETHGKERSLPS